MVSDEPSPLVKLELLSAVMKMFFKRPPESQEMLGRLLEHAIGNTHWGGGGGGAAFHLYRKG